MLARKFFIYVLVGVMSAAIDIGLMKFLMLTGIHHLLATTFGFITGLIVNFLLHTLITFETSYSHTAFTRYLCAVAVNFFLTVFIVQFFHNWINMPILGKALSLPLVAANGFLLSNYWIYKKN